jgi:hypothetical protein
MTTKEQAAAIIAQHANTKDADIRTLLSEARAAFRQGRYDSVAKRLSPQAIARQKSLG